MQNALTRGRWRSESGHRVQTFSRRRNAPDDGRGTEDGGISRANVLAVYSIAADGAAASDNPRSDRFKGGWVGINNPRRDRSRQGESLAG